MRTVWTNTTYADWLISNGVQEGEMALVELKHDGVQRLPFRVIGKAAKQEDIPRPAPDNKKWYTHLGYMSLTQGYSIHGTGEFQIRTK